MVLCILTAPIRVSDNPCNVTAIRRGQGPFSPAYPSRCFFLAHGRRFSRIICYHRRMID